MGAAHDYHKDSAAAIGDLRYLINERQRAADRPSLAPVSTSKGRYWRLILFVITKVVASRNWQKISPNANL